MVGGSGGGYWSDSKSAITDVDEKSAAPDAAGLESADKGDALCSWDGVMKRRIAVPSNAGVRGWGGGGRGARNGEMGRGTGCDSDTLLS
jgi:hypothetical protein